MFVLGNYQGAINEGMVLSPADPEQKRERDVLVFRAHIAKGEYKTVMDEIAEDSHPALVAVKCFANYASSEANREIALTTIKGLLDDSGKDETVKLIAASIYANEHDYDKAITALHDANSLEGRVLLLQLYLQIDRLEIAQRELQAIQKLDDDATLTQLALAWTALAIGTPEKIEEAFVIFTETVWKWSPTPLLLNALAVCHLARMDKEGELKLGERELLLSLEKDANNPDTVANLVVTHLHMGKGIDGVQRFVKKLKDQQTKVKHPWVSQLALLEESFDRNAARYSASKK